MSYSFDNAVLDAYSDNLLAGFRLEDASGGAVDDIGGNDLTTVNGTPEYQQTGKNGYAVTFDGFDYEYFEREWTPIDGSTDRTISLWLKLTYDDAQDPLALVSWGDGSSGGQFIVSVDWGYISCSDGYELRYATMTDTADNDWHHVFVRLNGTTFDDVDIFVDGSDEIPDSMGGGITVDTASHGASSRFRLASDHSGVEYEFCGSIDEVYIWDTALSNEAIAELYNSGTGTFLAYEAPEPDPDPDPGGDILRGESFTEFGNIVTLGTGSTQLLAARSGVTITITSLHVKHVDADGEATTVDLSLSKGGNSAVTFLSGLTVFPGETTSVFNQLSGGLTLEFDAGSADDVLYAAASAASSVVVMISWVERTDAG
jgi:hypothetical protein